MIFQSFSPLTINALLDLHFVFMDFLLWSCLEFRCHVYLDDVCASDKVTNAGNGLILTWLFVKMWFKVHRNVNDIRKQIIVFIKKHIIILFTHKSIHNSDRKGIKYRMSYPCWPTSLVVHTQFWSDQSAVDQIRVITKLPNSEQSYKGKVKTRK